MELKYNIVLYAVVWNKEEQVPFFLSHYEDIVDKIIIYDDLSTDNTVKLLKEHKKVEVRSYDSDCGKNLLTTYTPKIKNVVWKEYTGKTKWIFSIDFDEYLYNKRILDLLEDYYKEGISIPKTMGCQMKYDHFPYERSKEKMISFNRIGSYYSIMSKPEIFDPNKITCVTFHGGSHKADFSGDVKFSESDEIKLLHYTFFGEDYLRKKCKAYLSRCQSMAGVFERGLTADYETLIKEASDPSMPYIDIIQEADEKPYGMNTLDFHKSKMLRS